MGEAKRRKQLDANYGKAKNLEIILGNFIDSAEMTSIDPKALQNQGILDYGIVCPFTIVYPQGWIGGLAYPGINSNRKIVVGMMAFSANNSELSKTAQVQIYQSQESKIRDLIAKKNLDLIEQRTREEYR